MGEMIESIQAHIRQQDDILLSEGTIKAVLKAMREPTEAMHDAAHEAWDWGPGTSTDDRDADATRCWRTMIDAALREGE